MSILIKGMEMPESCRRCPLRDNSLQEDPDWCWVLRRNIFPAGSSKEPDCPLIEISDGHGRLIDADALINLVNRCIFPSDMATTLAVSMAVNWVKEAPTVIPADKDGET